MQKESNSGKNDATNPPDDDEDEEEEFTALGNDDRVLSRDWRAPAGKHIAIPVRIEPKVYFAAERTFLVCFSIIVLVQC
jgi:hypothetical protein